MDAILKGAELECAKLLGKCFENNKRVWNGNDFESLGLTSENSDQVLSTMEHFGLIADVTHSSAGRFYHFTITPKAAQASRKIAEEEAKPKEAPDIVKETMDQFRRNPFMGRLIFWGIAFGTLVIVTSNVITLVEKIAPYFK